MKRLLFLLVAAASFLSAGAADYFVRTSGTRLMGRDGKRLTMRGTNCGNWMVREPYMMNTSGTLDRQFKFDKMIADVCGEDKVEEFDRLWMDNNFCEADMKFLAEQGFNTLRVPMPWLQEGFNRIDSLCLWAERHGILLILDMHACPGGQSSGDICDYDSSKPSLWESEANRTKLTALWRKIAEHYKEQKCVAAYDLINETNWTLPSSNKLLWDTFKAIIKAIREVDANHIVILEGNSYSNDYTGFPSAKMDAKMMLQFHRYGVYNTKSQVQYMADMGTKYNCPVYIGEFGENSNSWTAGSVRLYEEAMQFAGWTCWPMKKSNINSILQVKRVASYDNVISQWQNGTRPSSASLWSALKAWAQAQHISRCTVRTDYIDALLRRPFSDECLPFAAYQTGDYVYAAHYDMGAPGRAYLDFCDHIARRAWTQGDQAALDWMYYLWCGAHSPLSGRVVKTFERAFVRDRAAWKEPRDPYYELSDDEGTCVRILAEFGLAGPQCRIINGHTPVRVSEGEKPVRAGGRKLIIDGGFCEAYHARTGIAGYTLVSGSHDIRIKAHRPFRGIAAALDDNADIMSESDVICRYDHQVLVSETDRGAEIAEKIADLTMLIKAYEEGRIAERTL